MRIRVSPRELAKQLPELRLDILQTYEDDLWIEGKTQTDADRFRRKLHGTKEERFPILLKHPEFWSIFTMMELTLISAFWEREETLVNVSYEMYESYEKYNNVCVHMKNVRAKLKRLSIPYEIIGTGNWPKFYQFKACG